MIVNTSALQRQITLRGLATIEKLATVTADHLRRLDCSPREAESVLNRGARIKAELEKLANDPDDAVVELPDAVGKVWLAALALYTRQVARLEDAAGKLFADAGVGVVAMAADALAEQLQDQLRLPIQPLDAVVREQDADDEDAGGSDLGLADEGRPADPRSRRGARPATASNESDESWDQGPFRVSDDDVTPIKAEG